MRYIAYLLYVLRHKRYVFQWCLKLKVPLWQSIVHDISKFRPDEFFPYARYFYESDGSKINRHDSTGYYKPLETEPAFDFAWKLHLHRNPHHWQWWCIPQNIEGCKSTEMPERFVREMVADWRGASKSQGVSSTEVWYATNGSKLQLHPKTRELVERLLNETQN